MHSNTTNILLRTFLCFSIICIIGCNNKFESGVKLINENKYREAINVLKDIDTKDNKYSDAQANIYYARYMRSVEFINDNNIDSAIQELNKVENNTTVYNKSISALNYCKALKSLEIKRNKDAIDFLSNVTTESEFYDKAITKLAEIKKTMKPNFQEFAKNFLDKAFLSPEALLSFSYPVISTSSILGVFTTTPTREYDQLTKNLKYYKKHKIKKNQIYIYSIITEYDPKGSEQGMQLHFREYTEPQTEIKTWKLDKIIYEGC